MRVFKHQVTPIPSLGSITINGGIITANGGDCAADGIGNGTGGSGSNIFVATYLVVRAGGNNPPTTVIPNSSADLAGSLKNRRYVSIDDISDSRNAAIVEINAAIEGVTDEDILAIATTAVTNINNAITVDNINTIKTLALAKINALILIQMARQGIQNAEINTMIDNAVNNIKNATTTEQINQLNEQIMTIITSVQIGKAEALGEMGVPCDDCPAVDVTKGTTTIRLYSPDKVEFRKME